jgi:hypothetical protein
MAVIAPAAAIPGDSCAAAPFGGLVAAPCEAEGTRSAARVAISTVGRVGGLLSKVTGILPRAMLSRTTHTVYTFARTRRPTTVQ